MAPPASPAAALLCLACLTVALTCTEAASLPVNGAALGRRFDGIGALSGGGATSRLLRDYDAAARDAILDLLFKPRYGASLHILKTEVGGDTFSGCGTEPSHMHTADDLSYERGYEWWLLEEATKRAPGMETYGLPWGFPAWIGDGALNPNMANYMTQWVRGAKEAHNVSISYLGIWNEDSWTPDYVKLLRSTLDGAGFDNTKLVVADNGESSEATIVSQMDTDPAFASAVDVIGVHYPGGSTSFAGAVASGKTLWSSEDSSTNDNDVGGGCWARVLNWNYVYGNYTATIMWNLISSYYEYLHWYGDSLMNAAQPWSGSYEVKSPVWITAHTTQFAQPGWTYLAQGSGSGELPGGGTYVTLVAPGSADFSMVLETMNKANSLCIRSNPSQSWTIAPSQNVTFQLSGGITAPGHVLHVWKSVLFADGLGVDNAASTATYLFEQQPDVAVVNGAFSLTIEADAVVSVTTTTGQHKGTPATPPASPSPFPASYSDDFDKYPNDTMAFAFSDQTGSFSVLPSRAAKSEATPLPSLAASAASDMALTQVVRTSPTLANTGWHNQDSPHPVTIIGDYMSGNYTVAAKALIADLPASGGTPLLSMHSCDTTDASQLWQWNASGSLPGSLVSAPSTSTSTLMCMDVYGCDALPDTAVWMWQCVDKAPGTNCDSRNQLWSMDPSGRLVTRMETGYCLTAPTLTMVPCAAADKSQVWTATPAAPSGSAGGGTTFSLQNAVTGQCLSSQPPPGTPAEALVAVAGRLGGPLSSSGCAGNPRELQCVQAYSRWWWSYGYALTVRLNGSWALVAGGNKVLRHGSGLDIALNTWHALSLTLSGPTLSGSFDGTALFSGVVDTAYGVGWAALGSGWHTAQFDDFSLTPPPASESREPGTAAPAPLAPAPAPAPSLSIHTEDGAANVTFDTPVLVGESPDTKYWFARLHGANQVDMSTGLPSAAIVSLSQGGDGTPCPPPGGKPQNCSASLVSDDDGSTFTYLGQSGPNLAIPLGSRGSGSFLAINYGGMVNASTGNMTAHIPAAVWARDAATGEPKILRWTTATFDGFPEPLESVVQRGSYVRLANGSLLTTLYGSFASDSRNPHTEFSRTVSVVRCDGTGADTGLHWHFVAAIGHAYNAGSVPPQCLGAGEPDLVSLADGSLLMVFRTAIWPGASSCPYAPFFVTMSRDSGASWSPPAPMCARGNTTDCAWSVFPQVRRLSNGALALTGGRAGLFLWVNADGTGRADGWSRVNVAAAHNALVGDAALRYSSGTVNITGPYQPRPAIAETTSYTGLLEVEPNVLLLSYDRVANGWSYPPGPYGDRDRVFTMRVRIEV